MNTAIKVLAACLLLTGVTAQAFQLGNPFNSPLGQTYKMELGQMVVPSDHLPSSCRLATEIKTAPIFPATTNPFVTDNAQLIGFVSLIGFGGEKARDADVALSALYFDGDPQNEVGVWGLKFSSPAAAIAHASLKQQEVLRKGALLITLWRDNDAGRLCQQAIKTYLLKSGFEKVAAKP